MKTAPRTICECDEQLTDIHRRYLEAMDRDDLASAADLWVQLHDLLDVRCALKHDA